MSSITSLFLLLVATAVFALPGHKDFRKEMGRVIETCRIQEGISEDEIKNNMLGPPIPDLKCMYACILKNGPMKMMNENGELNPVPKVIPNHEALQDCIDKIDTDIEDCEKAFEVKTCVHNNRPPKL